MATRTFVFDLDGVVYRGDVPIPGAVTTISTLRQLGQQVYFFTNNATKTRNSFVEKLARMNVPTDEEHVMTSAYATALYLQQHGAEGKRAYVVGESGLRTELKAVGIILIDNPLDEHADYVVAGLDRQFDYDKLNKAQQAIFRGAKFIATNTDSTLPVEEGVLAPGGGSIVGAIQIASGVEPFVIGKPKLPALHELMKMAKASPHDTIMIGDRLDTDILVGNLAKTVTVFVLTGISTRDDLNTAHADMQPDYVVEDLTEILANGEIMGK